MTDGRKVRVKFLNEKISCPQCPDWLGHSPRLLSNEYGGSFSETTWMVLVATHSLASTSEFKNIWG